jgi:hypothetical protein
MPQVRQTAEQDLVIADGFSCQEQIEQCGDRHALHLAQVMQLALRHGPAGPPDQPPEAEMVCRREAEQRQMQTKGAILLGCAVGGALIAGWLYRASRRNGKGELRSLLRRQRSDRSPFSALAPG